MSRKKGNLKTMNNQNNEKGMALLWVCFLIFGLAILISSSYAASSVEMRNSFRTINEIQAFYLAESGLDKKITEVKAGNTANINSTSLGNGTYAVTYDTNTKKVTSTGTYGGSTRTVTATLNVGANIPPGVKASMTGSSALMLVAGLISDGREHDTSGALTGNPGTYGMAYGANPSFDGLILPKVGGNGIAPSQPVNAAAKQLLTGQNLADVQNINTVLGLPSTSTALNAYKSTSPPSTTLNNQIYYYSPSNSGNVLFPAASINMGTVANPGTGILIIDNANHDSWVNLSGNFKGLVICDNCIFDRNSAITGGLLSVDTNTGWFVGSIDWSPTESEFTDIKYAPDILKNLPAIAGGTGGSTVTVKNWIDNNNAPGRLG